MGRLVKKLNRHLGKTSRDLAVDESILEAMIEMWIELDLLKFVKENFGGVVSMYSDSSKHRNWQVQLDRLKDIQESSNPQKERYDYEMISKYAQALNLNY